jgi:hypothetical protein
VKPHRIPRDLIRCAVPAATLAAIASLAAGEVDATAAAESAYLGRLAAAVLLAVAALAPPPAGELTWGAVLAVTAVCALPAGPGRGAATITVLAASLTLAAVRRLRRVAVTAAELQPIHAGRPAGAAATISGIALCFSGQVLLRGELLFELGRTMRPWVALVALPVVAGLAVAALWRGHGVVPGFAAAGAAMVLAPGWTVATTLAVVALAGGSWMGAAKERLGGLRTAACLAALLAPVAWEPRAGWVAALAGLTLWRPWAGLGLALPAAILMRAVPLPGALAAHASWQEGVASAVWLLLAVPAALFAVSRPGRRATLTAAVLLALATPWLPDRLQLAAPLALAALALPESGVAAGLGALWSAALLAGTGLLASYPWLRRDPAGDALALLGATPGPRLAAAVAAATLFTGLAFSAVRRRADGGAGAEAATADRGALPPAGLESGAAAARLPRIAATGGAWVAAGVAGAALFVAVVGPQLARPDAALLTAGSAVVLDRAHPRWVADIVGARPVRAVILQSNLVNAAGLANGTRVAEVRLLTTGSSAGLPVVAGRETGEWAARRADVVAGARLISPSGWMAWVAGTYFGQSYRARLPLARPGSFVQVQVDLAPGLPPAVGLTLRQVELER